MKIKNVKWGKGQCSITSCFGISDERTYELMEQTLKIIQINQKLDGNMAKTLKEMTENAKNLNEALISAFWLGCKVGDSRARENMIYAVETTRQLIASKIKDATSDDAGTTTEKPAEEVKKGNMYG